jgi:nicotinate-nucleotide pyrophosphorylase (carboxylating)
VTHRYQSLIRETGCRILDTRKTIPNLRLAQKYAVRCGGGMNHRIGLYDAFLLKENHLSACGSMSEAVHLARQSHPDLLLEVEVENLDQLQQAIDNKVDRVLLDNFNLEMLNRAVTMTNKRLKLEASGDITLDNILEVAQTGVDYISIGALTKHIKAVDFSLRFVDE